MDWLAFGIALVALAVSGLTAVRSSRRLREADDRAAVAMRVASEARAALDASTRALAEHNVLERAKLPANPWRLISQKNRFGFRNDSAETLSGVAVEQTNGNDLAPLQPMPVAELRPGEEIAFTVNWTRSSPPTAQVVVRWQVGDGVVKEYRTTVV